MFPLKILCVKGQESRERERLSVLSSAKWRRWVASPEAKTPGATEHLNAKLFYEKVVI